MLHRYSSVGGGDRGVVNAGDAAAHETVGVEFPQLIAVRAKPLAGVVVPFVFERNRNAISVKGPERLLEAVIEFTVPFAAKESLDFVAAVEEFGTISPDGIVRVAQNDFFGVAGVPKILSGLNFGERGFFGERGNEFLRHGGIASRRH